MMLANCRYAYNLKKKMIPVMMEAEYRPNGWLGAVLGMQLWCVPCHSHATTKPQPRAHAPTHTRTLALALC